jgi:hypothetical protein
MAFTAKFRGNRLKKNSTFKHPIYGEIKFKGIVNLSRITIEQAGTAVSVDASKYDVYITEG